MGTQTEAADQMVKIMLDGSEHVIKIAGAGAKQLAVLLYAVLKDQKRTKGKIRLTNMLRSGKELRIFPIKADELKKFCKEAKKYGVLYCVLRQKEVKDGVVDIMARAEDASKINRIFERLQISNVDMESIRAEIIQSGEPSAELPSLDAEDAFVEELFSPTPRKKSHRDANPTPATGSKSPSLSEHSSRNVNTQDIELGQNRPSVRKELERLRREQEPGRSRYEQPKTIHPEQAAPKKTRKDKSR